MKHPPPQKSIQHLSSVFKNILYRSFSLSNIIIHLFLGRALDNLTDVYTYPQVRCTRGSGPSAPTTFLHFPATILLLSFPPILDS